MAALRYQPQFLFLRFLHLFCCQVLLTNFTSCFPRQQFLTICIVVNLEYYRKLLDDPSASNLVFSHPSNWSDPVKMDHIILSLFCSTPSSTCLLPKVKKFYSFLQGFTWSLHSYSETVFSYFRLSSNHLSDFPWTVFIKSCIMVGCLQSQEGVKSRPKSWTWQFAAV